MVLKTSERRNNIAERLLQITPPILRLTWLTTLSEVMADPLGPIWIKPDGYRAATNGTPFEVRSRSPSGVYRRQFERDTLVESRVEKLRLLEG